MHHFYPDEYSRLDSAVHRIDARVKIIVVAGFVFFAAFTPVGFGASLGFYALLLYVLIRLARLPLGFMLSRSLVWVSFACMAALPLVFLRGPGERMIFLGHTLARAWLSVAAMTFLVSTTSFGGLLKAFAAMGCPAIFVDVAAFMYRYFYVLVDEYMKMEEGLKARAGRRALFRADPRVFSGIVAALFIRSYERGEKVYLAMCARGHQECARTAPPLSTHACGFTLSSDIFGEGARGRVAGRDIWFAAMVFVYLFWTRFFIGGYGTTGY